jgi:hypothetical protein
VGLGVSFFLNLKKRETEREMTQSSSALAKESSLESEDLILLFKRIGFADQKAKETAANKKIGSTLAFVLKEVFFTLTLLSFDHSPLPSLMNRGVPPD